MKIFKERKRAKPTKAALIATHYEFIVTELEAKLAVERRALFGCLAFYLNHHLVLVLTIGEEPWNGLMLPSEHTQAEKALSAFPSMLPHPILGKWLYLSQNDLDFENTANCIVAKIISGEFQGVLPKPKKKKSQATNRR